MHYKRLTTSNASNLTYLTFFKESSLRVILNDIRQRKKALLREIGISE